jgi:plasmid maintenance system antidote protein VapI
MSDIQDWMNDLREFEKTSASRGQELRLDLSEIILRHLDGKNWTQAKLAKAAGMKDPFLTRIIHAASNCTFDVAGRLLFALGVHAKLIEMPAGLRARNSKDMQAAKGRSTKTKNSNPQKGNGRISKTVRRGAREKANRVRL